MSRHIYYLSFTQCHYCIDFALFYQFFDQGNRQIKTEVRQIRHSLSVTTRQTQKSPARPGFFAHLYCLAAAAQQFRQDEANTRRYQQSRYRVIRRSTLHSIYGIIDGIRGLGKVLTHSPFKLSLAVICCATKLLLARTHSFFCFIFYFIKHMQTPFVSERIKSIDQKNGSDRIINMP